MNTLTLKNINKHYKQKYALCDFSYEFQNGIYALLGPNGAGKSTFMNIIAGNLNADDGGEMLWDGKKVSGSDASYREILGFMPQQQSLYESFTAMRFLSYIAALKGISKSEAKRQIPDVLALVELDNVSGRIGSFSGGMKQRLLIAQALLGTPKLIILDEPTAGLDPKQRVIVRSLITKLKNDHIIIVSTHIVSDVETAADKILIMKSGRIIADGSVVELVNALPESVEKTLENVYMQHFGEADENC